MPKSSSSIMSRKMVGWIQCKIDSPTPSVYHRDMKKLLSPKTDIVFKMLFEEDEEILADLIDSVLDRPENRRVRSVRVKNPGILPDEIGKKFIV